MKYGTPIDFWRGVVDLWMLGAETQTVMGYRLMGMAGLWNTAPSENNRMVSEKPEAMMRSARAAADAMAKGQAPHQIVAAAAKPLRAKTRANVARLSKRGPGRR